MFDCSEFYLFVIEVDPMDGPQRGMVKEPALMFEDGVQLLFYGFAFGFVVCLACGMGLGAMTWIRRFLAY